MARFDVYAHEVGALLDVQSDLLDALNTRLVVPLMQLDAAPQPAKRLNPVFDIDGVQMVMVTQFMAAVPQTQLRDRQTNLSDAADEITAAIDMLLQGF